MTDRMPPYWYDPPDDRDFEAEENDLLCKGDEIMERDQDR